MNAINTRVEFPSGWEAWNRDRLLSLAKNLKAHNEALVDYQIKFTEYRETEQEKWKLSVRCLEDQIFQLREDLALNEKLMRLASLENSIREGLIFRRTIASSIESELEDEELSDFIEFFNLLPRQHSGNSPIKDSQSKSGNVKKLKEEINELRSQISALANEKTFVWEQFNILEENLTSKLKSKQTEVDQSKEEIADLIATKETLQRRVNEKEEEITRLKDETTANNNKWKKELAKLSTELDELKKAAASQRRAKLGSCSKVNNVKNRTPLISVKQELSSPSNHPGKGNKIGSKRKNSNISIDDSTPKLFSSSFKVPKVKATPTL